MELYDLLAHVVQTFERLRIPYLVTGSVASMAYGEPRLTNDIDVVTGWKNHHKRSRKQSAFPVVQRFCVRQVQPSLPRIG